MVGKINFDKASSSLLKLAKQLKELDEANSKLPQDRVRAMGAMADVPKGEPITPADVLRGITKFEAEQKRSYANGVEPGQMKQVLEHFKALVRRAGVSNLYDTTDQKK